MAEGITQGGGIKRSAQAQQSILQRDKSRAGDYQGLIPWGRALQHPSSLTPAMAPDPWQWSPVCLVPFLEPNTPVLVNVHHVERWEVPKKGEDTLALSHTALSASHATKQQWEEKWGKVMNQSSSGDYNPMEGQRCWDRHTENLGGTAGSVVQSFQLCSSL